MQRKLRKRKEFSDLSDRQKRRIVLHETQLLNNWDSCNTIRNIQVSYKKLKSTNINNNVSNVNNLNSYNNFNEFNNLNNCNFNDYNNNDFDSSSDESSIYNSSDSLRSLNNDTLHDDLRSWVTKHNISQSAANGMLKILFKNGLHVPIDCRKLMKTPRNTYSEIIDINGGKYVHFGLAVSLKHSIETFFDTYPTEIKININIDGLPISKSSGSQFWPILGAIVADFYTEPFAIGIYHGTTKPNDVDIFLKPFVEEAKAIFDSGLDVGRRIISIKLNAIICDAPAKSFVCGIKSHNAYFSCTKCIQEGDFINNRIVFLELDSTLRTDYSFKIRQHKEHHIEKYQTQPTIIETLNIGMVSNIPLDCMHLIFLGVSKRLLQFWIKGKLNIRLSPVLLEKAERRNNLLKLLIPKEFARRPRILLDIDRWKATEFKLFLLYTGIIIMKDILPKKYYIHFTCLCVAIRIVSDKQYAHLLDYAQSILKYFVRKYGLYYGKQYISHNVHNLLHICADVKQFGTIDSFSAFKFENYLYQLKKALKVSGRPLEQIVNRNKEKLYMKNSRNKQNYPIIHYDRNQMEISHVKYNGFTISKKKIIIAVYLRTIKL